MKFIEILQEHQIKYKLEGHHHCRPGWIQVDCPWCSPGTNRLRMGYNIQYGYMNCWACGRHYTRETVAELTGLDLRDVSNLLRDVEREKPETRARGPGKLVLPHGIKHELLPQHRRYLKRRGFDPDEIAKLWDVQAIGPVSDGYAWRLFIPIHLNGEVVSWTTRSLSEEVKAKYKTAKENQEVVSHHSILYGADYVRHTAIVFEGPPNVWRVGPGAVCTCGTQWGVDQLFELVKIPRIFICFDPEGIAQERAKKLGHNLSTFDNEVKNVVLPSSGQDLNPNDVRELRRLLV